MVGVSGCVFQSAGVRAAVGVVNRFDIQYGGFLADRREYNIKRVMWLYLLSIEEPLEGNGEVALVHHTRHGSGFAFVENFLAKLERSDLRWNYKYGLRIKDILN